MENRVPKYPGRVLITPEDGSPPFYATMTRADEPTQEGTPINKETLLTDETAALFGLGPDATVNDTFSTIFERGEWKTLADVTVTETSTGIEVQLSDDLVKYKELMVVAKHEYSDLGNTAGISAVVYAGDNAQRAVLGNLIAWNNFGSNKCVGALHIPLVYHMSGVGNVALNPNTMDGGASNDFLSNGNILPESVTVLGFGTNRTGYSFTVGSRIIVLVR